MPEVRKERSRWRDEKISERHRLWGWDLPAVDVDFLVIEYDNAEPVAMVEYKNEHAKPQTTKHKTYQALIKYNNRAKLPFFAVRYSDDLTLWIVTPLNEHADKILKNKKNMTEREYVTFLYNIRNREAPKEILNLLNN